MTTRNKFIIIFAIILLITGLTGCNNAKTSSSQIENKSTEEQIRETYNTLIKSIDNSDFSSARSQIAYLEQICQRVDISEIDKKSAQCVYFYACGIYKLMASDKGVSGLQHPELLVIENNIYRYSKGEPLSDLDKTLQLAEQFYNTVNEEVEVR